MFLVLLAGVLLLFWYLRDITQKRHTVLRNFPIIGHLRFFLENLGEYFRQYFFLGDREEMPFNRATRAWVYRLAKNEGGMLGFGSTYDVTQPGALLFVNAAFPVKPKASINRHRRWLLAKAGAGSLLLHARSSTSAA